MSMHVHNRFAVAMLLALACSACRRDSSATGRSEKTTGSEPAVKSPGADQRVAADDPAPPGRAEPTIELRAAEAKSGKTAFEIVGLNRTELDVLRQASPQPERWAQIFAVSVLDDSRRTPADPVPILGTYEVADEVVRFTPQFPLVPGLRYRAVFQFRYDMLDSDSIYGRIHLRTGPFSGEFSIPKAAGRAATSLTQVYPSAEELPENTLKFYLHFSAAMSRGEAYRRIHLLTESGSEVELPFLELDQELWNRAATRFTLLFDPGRIKRGLKPREEVGPVLEEGKRYTLVIDRDWLDAAGEPLKESFRKPFRAGPPDDERPDPKTWRITPPASGTTTPLLISLPKPLDHAMLQHAITVTDPSGENLAGDVAVLAAETRWQFTPDEPWKPGDYSLVILASLEDLAGNSIARRFDVDLLAPTAREPKAETVRLPFRIAAEP